MQSVDMWQIAIILYGVFFVAGMLSNFIGIFVFWRFDKLFKGRPNPVDIGIPLFGMMGRILSYMMCIIFKNRSSKGKVWSLIFEGYDFQKNTNLFEKILSNLCVWGYTIGLCMALVAFLLKWLA